jgi:GntR family transcriptional regulator
MKIEISLNSTEPLYKQIYNQIKFGIFNGDLCQGEILPSIRQLAKELNLSVLTVKNAYNELEHDRYITTRPGKGCFVSTIDLEKEFINTKQDTEKKLKNVISESKQLGLNTDDIKRIFEQILSDKEKLEQIKEQIAS